MQITDISRLFYGDVTMVADLRQSGMTGDLPLAFRSEEDLIDHLEGWMLSYRQKSPPGSVSLERRLLKEHHIFLKPIYFATTSTQVEVERFEISKKYMGWILKDNDGSCVYVVAATGNSGTHRAYHSWLGGDKGFADEVIAASRRPNELETRALNSILKSKALPKRKSLALNNL